jgi:hypothetical protein
MDTEKDWQTEENTQLGGEEDMTGSKPGAGEEFQLNKADILERTIVWAVRLTELLQARNLFCRYLITERDWRTLHHN